MSEDQIRLAARLMGQKGGKSRSPRKLAAIAQNAKKAGRPKGSKNKPRKKKTAHDPEYSQE